MNRTFWQASTPLVLASGSATRAAMLEAAGLPLQVFPSDVDERAVEQPLLAVNANAGDIAMALAEAKAKDVSARLQGRWVVGADQTLTCAGAIFHKPQDRAAAAAQLAALAGRAHVLTSAAVVMRMGKVAARVSASATLTMRALTPDAIERYMDLAGPSALASVGCYQFEGLGVQLFERVEGDHFTILGLPLLPLLARLRDLELLT